MYIQTGVLSSVHYFSDSWRRTCEQDINKSELNSADIV